MKISDPDFPTFTELGTGDRVLLLRSDGIVGLVDVSLLGATGGETPPPPPPPPPVATGVDLIWTANGDDKGLFYYLGSDARSTAWANPITSNKLIVTSTPLAGGNIASIAARDDSDLWTQGQEGAFIQFDFGEGRSLKPTVYGIKSGQSYPNHAPRNWVAEFSNNAATWTVLDTQTNNRVLEGPNTWHKGTLTTAERFRYFKIRMTTANDYGNWQLFLGEVEIYGNWETGA